VRIPRGGPCGKHVELAGRGGHDGVFERRLLGQHLSQTGLGTDVEQAVDGGRPQVGVDQERRLAGVLREVHGELSGHAGLAIAAGRTQHRQHLGAAELLGVEQVGPKSVDTLLEGVQLPLRAPRPSSVRAQAAGRQARDLGQDRPIRLPLQESGIPPPSRQTFPGHGRRKGKAESRQPDQAEDRKPRGLDGRDGRFRPLQERDPPGRPLLGPQPRHPLGDQLEHLLGLFQLGMLRGHPELAGAGMLEVFDLGLVATAEQLDGDPLSLQLRPQA